MQADAETMNAQRAMSRKTFDDRVSGNAPALPVLLRQSLIAAGAELVCPPSGHGIARSRLWIIVRKVHMPVPFQSVRRRLIRPRWIAACAAATFSIPAAHAAPVLMVSIDGLRPGDLLEADQRGIRPPNLSRLMAADARIAVTLIQLYYPGFITVHFGDLEDAEHKSGPGSPEANAALNRIDELSPPRQKRHAWPLGYASELR